jgi:hypothetical protein
MRNSETCARRTWWSSNLRILRLRRRPYCGRISTLVLLALQCLTIVPRASGQVSSADVDLRVLPQGEVSYFWNVVGAGLREDFSGTAGYVKVKNVSSMSIEDAIFYGEYFDSAGRFCFSLVMSQTRNSGERGAIGPGETRVIGSDSMSLYPTSEPREVKIRLVQVRLSGQTESVRKWDLPLRTPITVVDTSESAYESPLQLSAEVASAKGLFLDLVFADVRVNARGNVTSVNVLQAASSQMETWFQDFAEHKAAFYPATVGSRPQDSHALVLVRAMLEGGNVQEAPLPQSSPWVKSYLQSFDGEAIPPLTNVLFTRPATHLNRLTSTGETVIFKTPPALPGLFTLAFQWTSWSFPAVRWVRDTSMPHLLKRELAVAQPQ